MKILEILRKLARAKAAGPSPAFTEIHILKAVEVIAGEGPIGRGRLSKRLRLGAGATRTLIDHLVNAGMITISTMGCILTEAGMEIRGELAERLGDVAVVPRSSITPNPYNMGILVKNCGHRVHSGLEQRDEAVRAGAKSATTLIFKEEKLWMPPSGCVETEDWTSFTEHIVSLFQPRENDVIILVGADGEAEAEMGARAAALTLLEDP